MWTPMSVFFPKGPGLAFKFGLASGITLIILLTLISVITLNLQEKSLNQLLDASYVVVDDTTSAQIDANKDSEALKATQLLKLLAQIAPSSIAEFDFSGLLNYSQVATEDPDISYVAIINNEGNTLASSGDINSAAKDGRLETQIIYDGEVLGKVILGHNHDRSQQQIKQIKQNTQHNLADMKKAKEESFSSLLLSQTLLTILIIATVVVVIYIIAYTLMKPLGVAIDVANKIAEGDLSSDFEIKSNDETGQLLIAMKSMADNLKKMVSQIGTTTNRLGGTAGEMHSMSEITSTGALQQQAETDQLANAIVEMSASAKEVKNTSDKAACSAKNADEQAKIGRDVVTEAIDTINVLALDIDSASEVIQKLEQHSESIGAVLDVIRGIAEQTNLLALNAAIEAARAGTQGRGFAVVADEVRVLAGRTQESTQEIHEMIEGLQHGAVEAVQVMVKCKQQASNGVDQAAKAGSTLDEITAAITDISDMNAQIAVAAKEQSQVTEEIARSVTNINEVANQTVESAQITSNSTNELNQLSTGLVSLVSMFKTGEYINDKAI